MVFRRPRDTLLYWWLWIVHPNMVILLQYHLIYLVKSLSKYLFGSSFAYMAFQSQSFMIETLFSSLNFWMNFIGYKGLNWIWALHITLSWIAKQRLSISVWKCIFIALPPTHRLLGFVFFHGLNFGITLSTNTVLNWLHLRWCMVDPHQLFQGISGIVLWIWLWLLPFNNEMKYWLLWKLIYLMPRIVWKTMLTRAAER